MRLAPYAALAAIFCVVEVSFMDRVRSDQVVFDLLPSERFALIVRNFSFYVSKSVFPANLVFVYPRWDLAEFSLTAFWPLLAWSGVLAWVVIRRPVW